MKNFIVGLSIILLSVTAFLAVCIGWVVMCLSLLGESWGTVVAILGAVIICFSSVLYKEVTEVGRKFISKFIR